MERSMDFGLIGAKLMEQNTSTQFTRMENWMEFGLVGFTTARKEKKEDTGMASSMEFGLNGLKTAGNFR